MGDLIMKTMTLDYYQDPGHGWVKIKLDKLKELGINQKITYFSYMRGEYAYLEEDCDLSTLIKACEDKEIVLYFKDHHSNRDSKIRNYQSYHVKEPLTEDAKHVISFMKEHFQYINVGG
jgi:hypothetical protein